MLDTRLIAECASDVAAYSGNIKPGAFVNAGTRHRLEALAEACGADDVGGYSDTDLISVYLVARKDAKGGARVVEKIKERQGKNGGFDPFRDPPPPPPPRKNEFDPLAPPPAIDVETVRGLIKSEVKEGALEPLQAALGEMEKSVRGDFAGYLSIHRDTLLGDLRAEMHNAATEALRSLTPTRLEIVKQDAPPIQLGLVHKLTPKVIAMLAAGLNVYLHGPAGSGKTTTAQKVAEAFGLAFYFAAKVESEYQLLGFKDARGETVRTQFREAYEHGGVFLFDEMDASSPSAVVAMNAALANGVCAFPDGTVKRHADFKAIAGGNTKLTGATRAYAGRSQLDAASIDRWAFLEFDYDLDLEAALATDRVWCRYVQAVRAAVKERNLTHLVTPRATYDGCKLLAAGFDWDEVASMVVYKGLDADTRAQLERAVDYSKGSE